MAFTKMTIRDVPIEHKVVLVRADYNVPLKEAEDGSMAISDDLRIRASLPTLRFLIKQGCKVVIMSHLGRPEGKVNTKYSLEPVAERLTELLKQPVSFVEASYGDKVKQTVKRAPFGSVIMLENLRFNPGEEKNSHDLAAKIASSVNARYFVQDGFGVVHRAHASTAAITQFIPSVAGLLLEREVDMITKAMQRPKSPLYALMGGAKISDKITVINALITIADKIIIGGAMANTFLAYKGYNMGKSKLEDDQKDTIDRIYHEARTKVGGAVDNFILLPMDLAVAKTMSSAEPRRVVGVDQLEDDDIALDIGDATIERYARELTKAKTAIWNGTMGYAEYQNFAHGSARVAMSLADENGPISIIGGGDTADFVLKWSGNDGKEFSHVSTGGGASLDLMAGMTLPGVDVLLDAKK